MCVGYQVGSMSAEQDSRVVSMSTEAGCSDGYQWLINQWLDYNYPAWGLPTTGLSVIGSGQDMVTGCGD